MAQRWLNGGPHQGVVLLPLPFRVRPCARCASVRGGLGKPVGCTPRRADWSGTVAGCGDRFQALTHPEILACVHHASICKVTLHENMILLRTVFDECREFVLADPVEESNTCG